MHRALFQSADITAAIGGTRIAGDGRSPLLGVSIDTRTIRPRELYVAIHGKRLDGHDFLQEAFSKGAAGAVVDRWPVKGFTVPGGVEIWQVQDTLAALGNLAAFHRRRFDVPVIAVTGSAGKTTTKGMLAHILSQRLRVLATEGTQNNLIGVPLNLLKLRAEHQAVVLELGTNQWGEIRSLTRIAKPTIGVVTNIGYAHLETFGDLHGVLKAKGELWETMKPTASLVLNAEDPLLLEAGVRLSHRLIWFGNHADSAVRAEKVQLTAAGSVSFINGVWRMHLPVPGRHNLMNALAALAAAQATGIPLEQAAGRLESFQPVPGRVSLTQQGGFLVIDDSYNANPTSLRAALEVFRQTVCTGRRIAVIGDMLELGRQAESFHQQAGVWVKEADADFLMTVGSLSRHTAAAARSAGMPTERVISFDDVEQAKEFLEELIRPGDALLVKGSRAMRMERILLCSITSSIH
ncbi:MAG: UDP-N-acetylmuramoyl-tripeptide--D-alanyl-D-alanine ligase [Candidatus Omnitrophica bacterium]|nr:UDP-N-acetylmuramoyl-tripeptide--D-alanyl-D-alanine ligase [Candidatus Omnitrophota bacterium]